VLTSVLPTLREGGTLRARLLGLVLIPLLGVSVGAIVQLSESIGSARASQSAEQHIGNAAAVDAARLAFEQEVVPAFATTVAHRPGLVETKLTTAQLNGAISIVTQLPELRSATERCACRSCGPSGHGAGRAGIPQ
jgi:hypothetical protein